MNLLPTLLAGAPVLFALGMLLLALTTTVPHLALALAHLTDARHAGDGPGPRLSTIPYARLSRDGR